VTTYDDRPWLALYTSDQSPDVAVAFDDALAMARATFAARPDDPAIKYFDGTLTWRELDEISTALAAGLLANGFERGDRLAVYLQNVPQFVIAMVATWKAGGIMVSINPMNRERELHYQLTDSGANVRLCLESLYDSVARKVVPDTDV
jgi:long-chain acyl-CoA synthetase